MVRDPIRSHYADQVQPNPEALSFEEIWITESYLLGTLTSAWLSLCTTTPECDNLVSKGELFC